MTREQAQSSRCRIRFAVASLKREFHAARMFRLLLSLVLLPATLASATDTVRIAAAANLVYALDSLNAAFRVENPDVRLDVSIGSSGNLLAQITHGAPYDVFLSADMHYPQALIASGQADAASLMPFARGRLVLWTTRPGLALTNIAAVVNDPQVRKLAIANTTNAPYGQAAKQVLEKLHLWTVAEPKLVVGENISQTAQFVSAGGADAGFVALSLVLSPKLTDRGHWLEVPAEDYAPLWQGAVLTREGAPKPVARRYLAFLQTPAARKVLERFGYGVPASGSADGSSAP